MATKPVKLPFGAWRVRVEIPDSPDELRLLTAYRNADERARKDALSILESYPREEKKENRA